MFPLSRPDRRRFLRSSAFTAAATLGAHLVPETLYANSNADSKATRPPLQTFPYAAIQLESGLAQNQVEETHSVLMGLGNDELLKPFRVRTGQPAPGADLGGWYDAYAFCPGHTFGQWLSALSRVHAITGDPATKQKITLMIQGLQQIPNQGQFFRDNRFTGYITEKLNCGLIDAYTFGGSPEAAAALSQLTSNVLPYLPEKALSRAEQAARPHKDVSYTWDETYTLPENYFLAWQRTGEARYRELGIRFLYNDFFQPISRGENRLPGMHAYSHLNSLNSAVQAYLALNDPTYLKTAVNGFNLVRQQSYATGGWGPNEAFVTPGKGELGKSLTKTHASFETPCGSYGEFKLTRSLLSITRDSTYGDDMETVMYNAVLGSKPLQPTGESFYYSDYNPDGHKVYHKDKWPCCSGTLPQIAADYRISSYLHDDQGVYVNLFLPSTLQWKLRGTDIHLRQSGSYPLDDRITFDIGLSHPERFPLHMRIPAWAGSNASININGKPAHVPVTPGHFATVDRRWNPNDRVELRLPMTLRLVAVDPETPRTVALMRGPLVLFPMNPQQAPVKIPESALLHAERIAPSEWLVKTPTRDLHLRPFTAIEDQHYSTYANLA